MKTFSLLLQDANHAETFEGISSFVGTDSSGCFGILADHARFMTTLVTGLARYRAGNQPWQYLAQPGSVVYFQDNLLTLSTRHYFRDENYMHISTELQQKLAAEEQQLHSVKHSLQQMEKQIFRHLWELRRSEGRSL